MRYYVQTKMNVYASLYVYADSAEDALNYAQSSNVNIFIENDIPTGAHKEYESVVETFSFEYDQIEVESIEEDEDEDEDDLVCSTSRIWKMS